VTSPENAKPFALLGIVFVVASVLILILTFFNYLQDGKISISAVIAFLVIFLGLMFYSRGKSPKGQDE
jgi:hypothetical protein